MSDIDKYGEIREYPPSIRILTVTGIISLFVSFSTSLALAVGFEHPQNDDRHFKSTLTRDTLIVVTIVFASIGFFLSCFVFYGHYLRNRYDPKSIIKGPMNIISFPSIDKEIPINDFREADLKPRYYYSRKNRLREDFL